MISLLPMAALSEGQTVSITVKQRALLVSLCDGQYYVVEGTCSHARQSLATGRIQGYEVSCPLHGAKFDIRTGTCMKGPATESIQSFPVVLEAGKVCIDL